MIDALSMLIFKLKDICGSKPEEFEITIHCSPEMYHRISYYIGQRTEEFLKYQPYSKDMLVNPVQFINIMGVKINVKVKL